MRTCAACGEENPAGLKFCGACGTPLAAPDVRGERKLVTVLSADLVARAGLHIVRGELAEAADVLGLIGSVARALTFYRSVGATRYVRQGESLVAVAS